MTDKELLEKFAEIAIKGDAEERQYDEFYEIYNLLSESGFIKDVGSPSVDFFRRDA